jgi:hypothetical protein
MALTIASLQRNPWSRITPKGYEPYDDDTVIGNAPAQGPKEAGSGSKTAPLAPIVRISVAKNYPDFAKKRLRDEGYVLDDAVNPDNTSPESGQPPTVVSSVLAVSRNYPPHIVAAFKAIEKQGRRAKLSVPG